MADRFAFMDLAGPHGFRWTTPVAAYMGERTGTPGAARFNHQICSHDSTTRCGHTGLWLKSHDRPPPTVFRASCLLLGGVPAVFEEWGWEEPLAACFARRWSAASVAADPERLFVCPGQP
jgi:hypothetical protein